MKEREKKDGEKGTLSEKVPPVNTTIYTKLELNSKKIYKEKWKTQGNLVEE